MPSDGDSRTCEIDHAAISISAGNAPHAAGVAGDKVWTLGHAQSATLSGTALRTVPVLPHLGQRYS